MYRASLVIAVAGATSVALCLFTSVPSADARPAADYAAARACPNRAGPQPRSPGSETTARAS